MQRMRLFSVKTKDLPKIKARIFVQDPLVAESHGVGLKKITLPGEAFLGPGPTTSRVAVVDYNAELDELFAPVTPLAQGAGFAVGGGNPIRNFKLHQTNVWAIITRTLNILEDPKIFGRRIPWAFPGGRLIVLPHAGYDQNAHYDRSTGSLNFYYFAGERGTVFTCLSHDIVTHELGHAVLDGLKPYYNEVDSPDAAGFHEYFGDALAMISSLTMIEVLKVVVKDKPGRLGARNLISDIALEFGSALEGDAPLRSAANPMTMGQLRNNWEEHDYSQVLTGAFYDILRGLYKDEVPRAKKARKKTKTDRQVAIAALISTARRTSRMMLRALDYCPPAGLTYLDYARAVIRADEIAYPTDDRGYRRMLMRAFRDRGIVGKYKDLEAQRSYRNDEFRGYDVGRIAGSKTDAYVFLDANRKVLGIPHNVNFTVWNLYRTRKVSAGGYYPPREIILEFGWSEDVELSGEEFGDLDGELFPLWCGGTLVFDSDGNVLHYIIKEANDERRETLKQYIEYLVSVGAFGSAGDDIGLGASGSAHRIAARSVGGRVQAVRNPALRHVGRKR